MTTFTELGFLSDEGDEFLHVWQEKHKGHHALACDVARLACEVIPKIQVSKSDARQVTVICYFARLLETFQGGYLLLMHGLEGEAAVLIRVCFTCLVHLKNACESADYVKQLEAIGIEQKKKILNGLLNSPSEEIVPEQRHEGEKARDSYRYRLLNLPKPQNDEQLAEKAGMHGLYTSVFRLTSQWVHAGAATLDQYFVPAMGKLKELQLRPMERNADLYARTLSDFALSGITLVSEFFQIGARDAVARLQTQMRALPLPDFTE